MTARGYLDWNATAPLRPEARAAMTEAMTLVGNPSSVHAEGRAARAMVERARAQVAAAVGCAAGQVVFTSGATEGAQLLARLGGDVVLHALNHDALWAQGQDEGRITGSSPDAASVLAIGLADGETGILTTPPARDSDGLFDVGQAQRGQGQRARWLFLDITQAVGRVPFSFAWSGADFAVLSAHKLGGPKGVGALILRDGLDIVPLSVGGGQEMGRRAGTENVIGISGFGAAAQAAMQDLADGAMQRVAKLRNILEETLAAAFPATIFVGEGRERLPNTSCIATPGWKAETQVMQMDLAGYAVSAGAACSSGKVRVSRVLRALGHDETTAGGAIRVSLGATTTMAEVTGFCDAWIAARTRYGDRRSGTPRRKEG